MSSGIDWQAYLDGSLEPEQRQRADALLRDDPDARRELDQFRRLIEEIKATGREEGVPMARLQANLRQLSREDKRGNKIVFGLFGGTLALGLAAYAVLSVMVDPMRINRSLTLEVFETKSPEAAAQWVRQKTGFSAPVIRLTNGTMWMSRYGRGWACYDYMVGQNKYYLYMAPGTPAFTKSPTKTMTNGLVIYQARGTGFLAHRYAWYVRGPDASIREDIAQQAWNQVR